MLNHPKNEARNGNFIFLCGPDNEQATFAAQSCNLIDMTLGETFFPAGPKDLQIPSNKITTDPLIVDVIVSEDYNEMLYFYKWALECKNTGNAHLTKVKPCEIITLDSQNQPGVKFRYGDCYPIMIEGLQYSLNSEGNDVLTSTVTLRYNIFEIIDLNGDIIDNEYGKAK